MDYLRTELSNQDKNILTEIYNELEKITLPTTYRSEGVKGGYHASKIGVTNQRNARQTIFGLSKHKGVKQESRYTKKYPHILPLFRKFIQTHYPEFEFNSVYVNRNTISKKHLDSENAGVSLLVGFGNYSGGETVLYLPDEEKFDINTHSLIFNGSKISHKSEPFEGTRYSLVFFK
jgi:hypothetical protein